MKREERDKILVEVGEGGCWHESSGMTWICGNCKTDIGWRGNSTSSVKVESLNPNFSEWANFGRLLKIARKKWIRVLCTADYWLISPIYERGSFKIPFNHDTDEIDQIPSLVADALTEIIKNKVNLKSS